LIEPHHHSEENGPANRLPPVAIPPVTAVPMVPSHNFQAVRVAWFVTGLIGVLVALRFALKLLGASTQSSFVSFIYGTTAPLVAPFHGIFPDSGQGFYIFEPASLLAIAIYSLIGWGVVTLIRITTARRIAL